MQILESLVEKVRSGKKDSILHDLNVYGRLYWRHVEEKEGAREVLERYVVEDGREKVFFDVRYVLKDGKKYVTDVEVYSSNPV